MPITSRIAGGDHAAARHFDTIARLWDHIAPFGIGFCPTPATPTPPARTMIDAAERLLAITGRIDLVHCNDSKDPHGRAATPRAPGPGPGSTPDAPRRGRPPPAPLSSARPATTAGDDIAWLRDWQRRLRPSGLRPTGRRAVRAATGRRQRYGRADGRRRSDRARGHHARCRTDRPAAGRGRRSAGAEHPESLYRDHLFRAGHANPDGFHLRSYRDGDRTVAEFTSGPEHDNGLASLTAGSSPPCSTATPRPSSRGSPHSADGARPGRPDPVHHRRLRGALSAPSPLAMPSISSPSRLRFRPGESWCAELAADGKDLLTMTVNLAALHPR